MANATGLSFVIFAIGDSDSGSMGPNIALALFFVLALAGLAAVGFVFALFAANAFLTVLQGTAAGAKSVEWQREPITEHFWKVFYLAWLILLWMAPTTVISRRIGAAVNMEFLGYVIPLFVFWIIYPVSQMSSLSGSSIWIPLRKDVFARLVQKPSVVLWFYLLSGVVIALTGLAGHWTFGDTSLIVFVFGVPLLIACWLLYSRLLGRLAFVLSFVRPYSTQKKGKRNPKFEGRPPGESDIERQARRGREDRRRVHQPSDQAPLQTPLEGPLQGYDVRFEDEVNDDPPPEPETHRRRPSSKEEPLSDEEELARLAAEWRRSRMDRSRRWEAEDDDDAPYDAHAPEMQPDERAPKELLTPKASEMELIARREPKKPERAWTWDLTYFLSEPGSMAVIAWLSILMAILGGLVRLARACYPGGGPGDSG